MDGIRKNRALFLAASLLVVSGIIALGASCSDSPSPTAPKNSTPAPPAGDISGTWVGTYNTNAYSIDCDTTYSLGVQAIFQQSGSNVTGGLDANGPCGLSYTFSGSLQGNTLSGKTAAYGSSAGTLEGTLAGGNLVLSAFDIHRNNMGQMQLHR